MRWVAIPGLNFPSEVGSVSEQNECNAIRKETGIRMRRNCLN